VLEVEDTTAFLVSKIQRLKDRNRHVACLFCFEDDTDDDDDVTSDEAEVRCGKHRKRSLSARKDDIKKKMHKRRV